MFQDVRFSVPMKEATGYRPSIQTGCVNAPSVAMSQTSSLAQVRPARSGLRVRVFRPNGGVSDRSTRSR